VEALATDGGLFSTWLFTGSFSALLYLGFGKYQCRNRGLLLAMIENLSIPLTGMFWKRRHL